jgi:hypothetical protein
MKNYNMSKIVIYTKTFAKEMGLTFNKDITGQQSNESIDAIKAFLAQSVKGFSADTSDKTSKANLKLYNIAKKHGIYVEDGKKPQSLRHEHIHSSVPASVPELAQLIAPVIEPVTEPVIVPVTEPVIVPVIAPVKDQVKVPVIAPVTEPLKEPFIAPVIEPVMVPVIVPVIAPVKEPVIAQVIAPVKAPETKIVQLVEQVVKPGLSDAEIDLVLNKFREMMNKPREELRNDPWIKHYSSMV